MLHKYQHLFALILCLISPVTTHIKYSHTVWLIGTPPSPSTPLHRNYKNPSSMFIHSLPRLLSQSEQSSARHPAGIFLPRPYQESHARASVRFQFSGRIVLKLYLKKLCGTYRFHLLHLKNQLSQYYSSVFFGLIY